MITISDLFRNLIMDDFDLTNNQQQLWDFVKEVLNRYCDNVEENQREDADINQLLGSRGKLKYLWWGLTYKIFDSMYEVYQLDYSTEPNFSILKQFFEKIDYFYRNSNFTDVENPIYSYMYRHLEEEGIDNFILNSTNTGIIEWNSEGINEYLREIFEINITAVCWTNEYLINNNLNDALSLYKTKKSSNYILPYLAVYAALGFTIHRMKKDLQNRHDFNQNLKSFIKEQFGTISNLYFLFLTPMFHELYDAHYSVGEVSKLYSKYLNSSIKKNFDKDDQNKLVELTKGGWDLTEMIQYEPTFWHFLSSDGRIPEKFTNFINSKLDKNRFDNFESFRYFLLTPCFTEILGKNPFTYKEVGKEFNTLPLHSDGLEGRLVYEILENSENWDEIKIPINKKILNILILRTPKNAQRMESLTDELFITPEMVEYYLSFYIASGYQKQRTILEAAQIAIVGPILYHCIVLEEFIPHKITSMLVKKVGFFEDNDVLNSIEFLFSQTLEQMEEDHVVRKIRKDPTWWREEWGVIVNQQLTKQNLVDFNLIISTIHGRERRLLNFKRLRRFY